MLRLLDMKFTTGGTCIALIVIAFGCGKESETTAKTKDSPHQKATVPSPQEAPKEAPKPEPKYELSYRYIESPFAFGDPMIKATLQVENTSDESVVVTGTTAVLLARRVVDGAPQEIELGKTVDVADPNSTIERNEEWMPSQSEGYGIYVKELDLSTSLSDWVHRYSERRHQWH
jgi:hypothetical protein